MNTNKSKAVVFTYSFDNDSSVYLFETDEDAVDFLRQNYYEQMRVDTIENGWDTEGYISDDGSYAKITNYFERGTDITEFHIANVYD